MKLSYAANALIFAALVGFAGGDAGAKPAHAGGKSAALPQLTVSVFDYTDMAAKDLEDAESCAARIYRLAGIELVWSNIKVDPSPPLPPHTFIMRIFRSSQLKYQHLDSNIAGFTWTRMPVSTMILDIVQDVARKMQLKPSLVLGCVFAHELGHMLIPGRPHAETGVMQSCLNETAWRMASRGLLLLSDDDARSFKQRLRKMASAKPAS